MIPETPNSGVTASKTAYERASRIYSDLHQFMLDNFVYLDPTGEWYDVNSLVAYPRPQFIDLKVSRELCAAHAAMIDAEGMLALAGGGEPRKPGRAQSAAQLLLDSVSRVTSLIRVFGRDRILDHEVKGVFHRCLNLYVPSRLEPSSTAQTDEDVSPWVEHVRRICGREAHTGDTLLDWMAWVVQNPTKKVRWAPLIYSGQGIGKDMMTTPLINILGSHNTVSIEPAHLESQFNGYDVAKLVVLNEMVLSGRFETYDKIKPKISGTGSGEILINEKFKTEYHSINTSAWLIFTNHDNALPIDDDDRRTYVIHGQMPCPDADKSLYFGALDSWITDGGSARVYRWLVDRCVAQFNPNHPPAPTEAKRTMQWEGLGKPAQWLASELTHGDWRDRTVISRSEINFAACEVIEARDLKPGHVQSAMKASGFVSLGVNPLRPGREGSTRKTTIYVRSGGKHDTWSPELRDILHAEMSVSARRELLGEDNSDEVSAMRAKIIKLRRNHD